MSSSENYLLGIDIGTSQSKGTLTTFTGEIIATHALDHETKELRPGYYEHDPHKIWYGDFCKLSKSLLQKTGIDPQRIAAVGVSAIGPCVLPVDQNGTPLRNGILYGVDTRSTAQIEQLNQTHPPDYFLKKCGNLLSAQAAGPKILWIKQNEPALYGKTACFMTATTYIVYRLTGESVMDHYTAAAGYTPLYDYDLQRWSEDFSEEITPSNRLPKLLWSSEIAGSIHRKAAIESGLAQGTPVIAGTCDAAAEAVSVGVVEDGRMMLMFGTTVFIAAVTEHPAKSQAMWSAPFLFPDTYCILGGMSAAGSMTSWFKTEFAQDIIIKSKLVQKNPYDLLMEEAATAPPGCDGLVCLPYFNGERTPLNDPHAKGVFFGLTFRHTRAHLYRAIFESVGYGIRHNLEQLASMGELPNRIFAVGGGVKSELWLQIVSDITGIPQTVYRVSVGASYGSAFLAGLGIKAFSSPTEIYNWLEEKQEILPNRTLAPVYEKQYRIYKSLYQRTKDLMHDLSNRSFPIG